MYGNSSVVPEDTDRTDPVTAIYGNIENEPLVRKIKDEELKLLKALGYESVMEDIEEAVDEANGMAFQKPKEEKEVQKAMFESLLRDFRSLLGTKYGALGYLVSSDSESIKKLYGIDTDVEFCCRLGQSRIKVPNPAIDSVVAAGGGRQWGNLDGRKIIIQDPKETDSDAKTTEQLVNDIIAAIKKRLATF